MELFGNGELAVRSLSAVFSCLAILVFFDLCRQLNGTRVALLAAAIMSLSIAQIEFGQNARSYALLIFLGLTCADLLVRIEKRGRTRFRFIALTFALTALALTHYNAWGLIAALAIYAAIHSTPSNRFRTLLPFMTGAGLIAVAWLYWMRLQFAALPSMLPTFLAETSTTHTLSTLLRAIGLPGKFLVGDAFAPDMPSAFYISVAVVAVCIPIVRLFWRRDFLLWIFWLMGTIGFAAAVDLAHRSVELDYLRYTILASPAIFALLASTNWPNRAVFRDAIPLINIALLTLCVAKWLEEPATPKEDWRTLIHHMDRDTNPDELLVFYGNDPWISPGAWYLALDYYAPDSHHPWLILNRPADAALLGMLASQHTVILVGPYPRADAPNWLPGWIPITPAEQTTAGAFCWLAPVRANRKP